MIRVLIVDDHAVVRRGLIEILEDTDDIVVTGQAANGAEALQEAQRPEVDLVVMDISMPGMNGIEATRRIRALRPQMPVVILSIHPESQYAVRSLKAGAAGYITKESAPQELIEAVRTVSQGKRYISNSLAQHLAADAEKGFPNVHLHDSLSEREYQVLVLFGKGKTVKEIALELDLSVKTVSTYRARIQEKLGLHRPQEISIYAIRHELVVDY